MQTSSALWVTAAGDPIAARMTGDPRRTASLAFGSEAPSHEFTIHVSPLMGPAAQAAYLRRLSDVAAELAATVELAAAKRSVLR